MKRTLARAAAIGVAVLATALVGAGPALAETPTLPPGPPQTSTPAERAAATVRPAITYISGASGFYVVTENGTVLNPGKPDTTQWSCTGFGINPNGYIATAGHCVDPEQIRDQYFQGMAVQMAQQPTAKFTAPQYYQYMMANWTLRGDTPGSPPVIVLNVVSGSTSGTSTSGQKLPARVVDFRPGAKGDVALLKVEATGMPSTLLAADADVQIGTSVLSIGYPGSVDKVTDVSLEPSVKDGRVSSKKTADGFPVYETSAAVSAGMSGGPTVDLDGRVIGINSRKPAEETQAFNFVAPASGMSELLARNGVRNELGPDDTAFRDGLQQYYTGHYTRAIADFDHVLQTQPQHAQANQFKGMAAKARDQFGDVVDPPAPILGMSPLLFWSVAGGVAVMLLVAVSAAVVAGRRRRGSQASGIPQRPDRVGSAQAYAGYPGPQQPVPYGQPPHLYTPQYETPHQTGPRPVPAGVGGPVYGEPYHPPQYEQSPAQPGYPQSAQFVQPSMPWAVGPQYPPAPPPYLQPPMSDQVPSYVQAPNPWAPRQQYPAAPPPIVPEPRQPAASESNNPTPA
jgi:S1-C subfamily serine protease